MPRPRPFAECLSEGWKIAPLPVGKARRGATQAADPMVGRLLAEGRLELVQALEAKGGARRVLSPTLELNLAPEALVLLARHASGALSFHLPAESAPARRRFSLPISPQAAAQAVQVFALKIAGTFTGLAIPALAGLWEQAAWKRRRLAEGWMSVSREALAGASPLAPADLAKLPPPPQRNLLLLHGTFSDAKAAFPGLADVAGTDGQDFFSLLRPLYGDRVFAFNHFTVSRSPEDNARMLLDTLPARPALFDCITHSRGGLVLRHLVERRAAFGPLADRFELGRAVLVASPNQGTPLASPQHFDKLLGWLANLVELYPGSPFTFAFDLVAEGLTWLAHRAAGSLPGLAAMDANGPVIAALQARPGPPEGAYSALVANYEPDQGLLQRIVDAGVDAFFRTANDMVVPTEGGWRTDPATGGAIPGDRIGCFGRGGNQAGTVTHTTFFSRPESIDFLMRALRGEPQPLPAVDPAQDLPYLARRGAPQAAATVKSGQPFAALAPSSSPAAPSPPAPYEEIFHLAVLSSSAAEKTLDLMASFRNARVLERFDTRDPALRRRWRAIEAGQDGIRNYIDGQPGANLPRDRDLVEYGRQLFEVLFPGDVRRLYDVARALQTGHRLSIVLTSMIDWIADKPWEFAYDPSRKNFLAVEDVNFIRNVLTAVPADRIAPRPAPLRILVVVAQPLGTARLSVEEETKAIRSGFQRLIDTRMAEVDVLLDATPDALHCLLETSARPVDVLHFVGHGVYDERAGTGYLIFENEEGGVQQLDSQVLRQIVCHRDIRLVFLNACETGQGGRADFNRGVAPALVAGGVPAVVANQYSVLDSSATSFARHFYWALAEGRSIGDAARESRVAVNYSISGESIDWAVPVVYARNPGDVLCTPVESAARAPIPRRVAVTGATVIGLWDVNRLTPGLSDIADKLNSSQNLFRFQLLSFSAPLGTWQRDPKTGQAYLRVDEIVRRLQAKPEELGVDRLIAITNLPLWDNRPLARSTWDKTPQYGISILSTYRSEERLTDAIAGLLARDRTGKRVQNPQLREALANIAKSFA